MCISNEFVCFKHSYDKNEFVLHRVCLNAPAVACVRGIRNITGDAGVQMD